MRRLGPLGLVAVQGLLVIAVVGAVASDRIPLGVPGEWVWLRPHGESVPIGLGLALAVLLAYAGFAALGSRALRAGTTRRGRAAWLIGLVLAAIGLQLTLPVGAPTGYGLEKWTTLGVESSSGYFSTADRFIDHPGRFWATYPDWIRHQDSLHIGTHPPGLLLTCDAIYRAMRRHPNLARAIDDATPDFVRRGFRVILGDPARPARAAIVIMGMATLVACAATVAPIYALARATATPAAAWAAAALWPLVPAAILFQPTADTAYPLLSATALALAAGAGFVPALLSGVTLAIGMQYSLVFLPVGLIVGLVQVTRPDRPLARRLAEVATTGGGFLAVTSAVWVISGANPFVIWLWNAHNHARFYVEYRRSLGAWMLVNPLELAIAVGMPVVALLATAGRALPRPAWITLLVLAGLTISGRNLGEVARLWLPFVPALVAAAGVVLNRFENRPLLVVGSLVTLGVQTLALQILIQVVYPV